MLKTYGIYNKLMFPNQFGFKFNPFGNTVNTNSNQSNYFDVQNLPFKYDQEIEGVVPIDVFTPKNKKNSWWPFKIGKDTKSEDTGSTESWGSLLDKDAKNKKEFMNEYMKQAGKLQAQNRIYSNFNNFAQSFGKGEMLKADAYANMSNRMANVTNSIKYTGAGTRPVVFPSFRYF